MRFTPKQRLIRTLAGLIVQSMLWAAAMLWLLLHTNDSGVKVYVLAYGMPLLFILTVAMSVYQIWLYQSGNFED